MRSLSAFSILLLAGGCTQWGTQPSYGPQTEIARRLVGSPQVEETSESNISAGFGTASQRGRGTRFTEGSLSGSHDSVSRTHCVQQAEIDYTQSVDLVPEVNHRVYDVAGVIALGVTGLAIAGFANSNYNSDEKFHEMDPSFFAAPATPTLAYAIGGSAAIGAAAWLIYALGYLPKGPKPVVETQQRQWTETQYVEAQGCGLVPADRP